MNSSIKKITSLFIISLILFNSSGYILLYISSTPLVKKYVIKKLLGGEYDKEIILLSISRKDITENRVSFKWIHSKEFRFNGKMYDIKKNLSDSDSLRFYCYYDEKENLLEELFNRYLKDDKEKSKNRVGNFNFLAFVGLVTDNSLQLVLPDGLRFLPITYNLASQTFIDVLTPPPQELLVCG